MPSCVSGWTSRPRIAAIESKGPLGSWIWTGTGFTGSGAVAVARVWSGRSSSLRRLSSTPAARSSVPPPVVMDLRLWAFSRRLYW